MIISHEYRYLFVEVPRTGSTAISAELRKHYGGEAILKKHAYYSTFLRQATEQEKTYRVFSGVRNPLDDAVSSYRKLATRPREYYAKSRRNLRRFDLVNGGELPFSDFLKRFYRFPFDHWTSTYHQQFAKIIRFEHLKSDFAEAIDLIGAELVRPLPQKNRTNRDADFESYYSESDISHAVWIFGPYMRAWGYELPKEWKVDRIPTSSVLAYRMMSSGRKFYWNRIRQDGGAVGGIFRRLFLD